MILSKPKRGDNITLQQIDASLFVLLKPYRQIGIFEFYVHFNSFQFKTMNACGIKYSVFPDCDEIR